MLNKKTGQKLTVGLTALTLTTLLSAASSAQTVIYDNSETLTNFRTDEGNGVEYGDFAIFSGTDRNLSSFQFDYFLSSGNSGNEFATVRFYALDGPTEQGVALPSTLLWTSDTFEISSGRTAVGFGQRALNDLGFLTVPDSVAWTVTFTGLEGTEGAGLLFATDSNGPGANPTFLDSQFGTQQHFTARREANGSWTLLNTDGVEDNLSVRFTAVPEPTTWALMLGGLAVFGLARRRK
jgi:hypothetical protein